MKIAIASDHAGFEQKGELAEYLVSLGHEIIDFGPYVLEKVDYPDYAEKVGKSVSSGESSRGVLVCGTGIGMAIAANKIDGIRAANVTNPLFAQLARAHNNINVISLSGRHIDCDVNKKCLSVFLNTDFEGGRHEMRVKKIMGLES